MDRPWTRRVSKCCLIPQRYVMVIMTSLAMFHSFTMRSALQVALLEMVQHDNETVLFNDTCPNKKGSVQTVEDPKSIYHWKADTQEYIVTSFYWGYILTHVPAGILCEFYGAKHIASAGVLLSSLITVITPVVIRSSGGKSGILMLLRILLGLGQGSLYPSANAILAQWIPKRERSAMAGIVYSGEQLGTLSCLFFGGEILAAHKTWTWIFYIFGILGFVWWIFWQMLCFSSPETHIFISDKEKEYLRNELAISVVYRKKDIPWADIFKSSTAWSAIGAEIGHNWAYLIIVTEVPKYLRTVLKMSTIQITVMTSIPFLFMWIMSIVSGFICDWLINRKYLSVTRTRKFFTTIGYTGSGLFLSFAIAARCNQPTFIVMFVFALTLMSLYNSGTKTISLDLAPNWSAVLAAIISGCGSFVGIMAPIITVFTTPHQTLFQWKNAVWVSCLVSIFTNVVFVAFAVADEASWNIKRPEETPTPVT